MVNAEQFYFKEDEFIGFIVTKNSNSIRLKIFILSLIGKR